jgi:ribosomal protein S18 acetylase RimI-like enzyme
MSDKANRDRQVDITIRRANADDFLAAAQLDREAWQDTQHGELIHDGEHTWRIWCEHSLVILAMAGNEVLGVALAFAAKPGLYCVHKVMVAKAARGRGVGTKLLDATAEALDQLQTDAYLTVAPGNAAAERLYNNYGFAEARLVEGYYREDEHRLVLTRRAK